MYRLYIIVYRYKLFSPNYYLNSRIIVVIVVSYHRTLYVSMAMSGHDCVFVHTQFLSTYL